MKSKLIMVLALLSIFLVNTSLVRADMICGTWAKNDTTTSSILSPSDITANRSDLVFKCLGGSGGYGGSSTVIQLIVILVACLSVVYFVGKYYGLDKPTKVD